MRIARLWVWAVAIGLVIGSGSAWAFLPFTYQGQLRQNGVVCSGLADMQFSLYDSAQGGTLLGSEIIEYVSLTNGLFSVELNAFGQFPLSVFDGSPRWMEVAVRYPADSESYTTLSPRQQLTATPYAYYALRPWARSGTNLSYAGGNVGIGTSNPTARLEIGGTPGSDGIKFPDGTLQTTAAAGGSGGWSLTGNAGTTPGTHFIGTTDGQPLIVKTNSVEAMRVYADGAVYIGSGDAAGSRLRVTCDDGVAIEGVTIGPGGGMPAMKVLHGGLSGLSTGGPVACGVLGYGSSDTGGSSTGGDFYGDGGDESYGVYASAGHAGTNYGIYVDAWAGESYGIYSDASGDLISYGGYFRGHGADNQNYGIYAEGTGGLSSYAGYFQGDLFASGNVGIGTAGHATARLEIGGAAGVDGIKFPDGTLQTTACTGGGAFNLPFDGRVTSSATAFKVMNLGPGRAGQFVISFAPSENPALEGVTDGGGSAVQGTTTGRAPAGQFLISNTSSSAPAVYASTSGTGPAIRAQGVIESRSGGFQFPDGSIQSAAAAPCVSAALTVDPPSLPAAGSGTLTVTVTGAEVGDAIVANPGADLPAGYVIAWVRVSAANTIRMGFTNGTPASLNPAASTWAIRILK